MTNRETPQAPRIAMPASVPTRESERLAGAAGEGIRGAAEGAGRSLRLNELRLRVPAGANAADIARAVRRALLAATGGRR